MKKVKIMIPGIILIIVGIVLDQVSKVIIKTYLVQKVSVIGDFFELIYVENRGAGWGMFKGQLWFLIIVTFVALGIFTYLMKDFDLKNRSMYSISLILMVAGTFGNFIDRIFRGYVIDFLQFNFGSYTFPTFNIADSFLTIGVIILAIDVLFGKSGHLIK
jgi:signal peptidase II